MNFFLILLIYSLHNILVTLGVQNIPSGEVIEFPVLVQIRKDFGPSTKN